MRHLSILVLALAFILGITSAVFADFGNELGVGARALGMGGAFVAVADDGTAAYWNPAGITQLKVVAFTPCLTGGGNWTDLQLDMGSEWPPNFGDTLLELDGMFGVTFRGFGISLIVIADSSTQYTTGPLDTSDGLVEAYGVGMVTLAHGFSDLFSVGLNLKYIYGQSLDFSASGTPGVPITYTGWYIEGTSTGYAADVGAMFKVGKLLRVGAAIKNYGTLEWTCQRYDSDPMNPGSFILTEYTDTETLTPVAQVGVAVQPPIIGTLFAAQVDMPLAGGGPMTYRLGIEQSLLFLKARIGGIMVEGFDPLYTAGLGFKLGPVVMDTAALVDGALEIQAAMLTFGFTF